jgi:hypothetical protein
MLTVEIINDGTGTNTEGNYDYRVLVNGKTIAEGRVEGHARIGGWAELLKKVSADGEHRRTLQMYAELARVIQEGGFKF